MSQTIKNANIFGRIGSGIGQGLAEQIPKEIERGRLASGLKELEKESGNLTPLQNLSRLAAIPGALDRPQLIQSYSELAKQQGIRNSYQNSAAKAQNRERQKIPEFKENLQERQLEKLQFADFPNKKSQMSYGQEKPTPKDYDNPVIEERNPLSPEFTPKGQWTPDRRNQERAQIGQDFPWMTDQQINELASDNETRELRQPEAESAIDERLKAKRIESDTELDQQLKKKTHRLNDEELLAEIPGEIQEALKRGMRSELATNPNTNIPKLAHKWSDIGLQNVKAAKDVDVLLNDEIFQHAPSTILDKLKSAEKAYENAENKEGYFNKLREKGFSDQRSAQISYPRSKNVKSYINNHKRTSTTSIGTSGPEHIREQSRKAAKYIEKLITPEDSLLAIARDLKDKDPYFDESAFFNQIREDRDRLGLTPFQNSELYKGEAKLVPKWLDIWVFPWFRGGK